MNHVARSFRPGPAPLVEVVYRLRLNPPWGWDPTGHRTASVVESAFRLAARPYGLRVRDVRVGADRVHVRMNVPPPLSPLAGARVLCDQALRWLGKTVPVSGRQAEPAPPGDQGLALTSVRI